MSAWIGISAAVVLTASMAGAARAQPPAPPPSDATVSGVTVTAPLRRSLEPRVRAFVQAVAAHGREQSLVRWQVPVCPGVRGMTPAQAQYVTARIAQIARQAGAPVAAGRCQPNLYVIASRDPTALVAAIAKEKAGFFSDAPPARVEAFVRTERPVRVWYGEELTSARGMKLVAGQMNRLSNNHADDSRLTVSTLTNAAAVMIVVDARRTGGLKLKALADYLAMVGLSRVDLDAGFADAPTVLRLFQPAAAGPAPEGLTDWDEDFLFALYHSAQDSRLQAEDITERMLAPPGR